jgi:glycosyltransferase involved in cell wall biosynthesis
MRQPGARILSMCTVFPTAAARGRGLFVRSRLEMIGRNASVKVIAPVPIFGKRVSPEPYEHLIEVMHPRWFYIPGTGAITPFLLFARLWPVIRRVRRDFPFDILDAHFGYPDGIAAALISSVCGAPFMITLRGSELLHARYRPRLRLMSWAFRRASRIIAVSGQLAQFAVDHGADPACVRKIPNGLNAAIFHPRDRQAMRVKHNLPLDRPVILSAGHLIQLKGHHQTVAAVRMLHDSGIRALLIIAGASPARGAADYSETIRTTVSYFNMNNHVRFVGEVAPEALAELMSAADVFCLASSREGWPNVVHEALGCGTPVVATRVGAAPDLVTGPEYGILTPPGDVPALAGALKHALETDWDRGAIARWGARRSWQDVAGEVLKEIRHIVAERRTRLQISGAHSAVKEGTR